MRSSNEATQNGSSARREIWALEQELAEKPADDQDVTRLKRLIEKSTQISKHMERPSDQANSSAMFKKMTATASTKVKQFCRSTAACSSTLLHQRLTKQFANNDAGKFDWGQVGNLGAHIYHEAEAGKISFMMGAIEPPKVKAKKPRDKKKSVQGPTGPELQPEIMDTNKQDDSNETSKLTETMYRMIEEKGRQPWVFYILDHQSFAQTVENMFSVAMLLGNAKAALVTDSEWGMCVQLPAEKGGSGQRSAKPEQSQMVINLNDVVWEKMKNAVRPEQCLTTHRADLHRADDERCDENRAGHSKRARLS